ncbi:MAG: ABC transporter substrate-binding protein [Anaerolineales bacterium]|nr:ABC transporter substrate-binding protein [Anaerolineales bacterium]
MRKTIIVFVIALSLLVPLIAACSPQTVEVIKEVEVEKEVEVDKVVTATPEPEERKLEIFHWWVGPGEREAADEWFKALHAKYPEVEVIENPVAGGGGVSHRVVLQTRLAAGLPPDTFQALGGAEIKAYVDGEALEPLDDLWNELDYSNVIPGPLANTVVFDGHPYGIPLNMHIQNILYFDKNLFDELGLDAPKTFDELMAVSAAIKEAKPDMYPLALGTSENWEAAFVLDTIILEEGGPEYYVALHKGEIDVTTDPIYRASLEKLAQLKQYIYPFHSNLTWDQSVSLVISGDSAMVTMGTWAIGAFLSNGWTPGVEFSALTYPQGDDRYLLFHADAFGLAKGAAHPQTALDFLEVTGSPELQIPCDVVQGGLFARIDIDPQEFPDPIRQEMQAYVRDNPTKLILDQHGSIAPAAFSNEYWIAIAGFMAADEPDIDATISQVDTLMKTYDVLGESTWYVWP